MKNTVTVRPACESCGKAHKVTMMAGKKFCEIVKVKPGCKCEAATDGTDETYEASLAADAAVTIKYGYGVGDDIFDAILTEYVDFHSGGAEIPILAGPLEVFTPVEQVVPIIEPAGPGYFNGTHFVPLVRAAGGRFAPVIQVGR